MRVGFIGLGTMGQHLANHLQEGGYDLVVNDIREERATTHLTAGAAWAANPSAVMAACDVVFTSVPTPADVEAIALGPNGLIESAARARCSSTCRRTLRRSCVGSTTDSSRSAWRFSMHPSAAAFRARSPASW